METVLVPVDGSEQSREALEFALEKFPEAAIHLLHVAQVTSFPEEKAKTPADIAEEKGETILDEAAEIASEHGQPVRTALRHGETATEIAAYAGEEPIDIIVIGSRGRGGIRRLLLGSVAESVVRRAPTPVTVIH